MEKINIDNEKQIITMESESLEITIKVKDSTHYTDKCNAKMASIFLKLDVENLIHKLTYGDGYNTASSFKESIRKMFNMVR